MTTPPRRFRREPAWTNRVDTVGPVADRRLSGTHWWDPDRLAHAHDAPAFCPSCGTSLDALGSLAVEYWEAERRVFHIRCAECDFSGDIARVVRLIGPDAPH